MEPGGCGLHGSVTAQYHLKFSTEILFQWGPKAVTWAENFAKMAAQTPAMSTTMIRFGPHIRLTRREAERFKLITDLEPVGIRTLADLDAYIAQCKAHYWGVSRDTQFLHWLIDREYQQCRSAS